MRILAKSVCVLSIILVCGVVSIVSAAEADFYEPDNISDDAESITTDGVPQSHSIHSIAPGADVDWLTFTLTEQTVVLIETSGDSGDTVISLYTASNLDDEIAFSDDIDYEGGNRFSRIRNVFPAGTYYLEIHEYNDKNVIDEYFVSVLAYAEPDVVSDGIVNLGDFGVLSYYWGPSDPNIADLDHNGTVDVIDLELLAVHWLEIRPPGYMVRILAGAFVMGDHHDGISNAPTHNVYLDAFYMSKFEVTNQQYCGYLNDALSQDLIEVDDSNDVYAYGGGTDIYCGTSTASDSQIEFLNGTFGVLTKGGTDMSDHPVVVVSWYGAAAYCNWLSDQKGFEVCYNLTTWECDFSKHGFRLATEAEWEYAARGGDQTPYYRYPWGSDDIDGSSANYTSSGDPYATGGNPHTSPVGYYDGNQTPSGSDMANGYGLYDMAGNVWEWCNDWYDNIYENCDPDYCDNPVGPASSPARIVRGGSWFHNTSYCRVASRGADAPEAIGNSYGFRVVLDLE